MKLNKKKKRPFNQPSIKKLISLKGLLNQKKFSKKELA